MLVLLAWVVLCGQWFIIKKITIGLFGDKNGQVMLCGFVGVRVQPVVCNRTDNSCLRCGDSRCWILAGSRIA
ncbi:MAG: hypothetical protein FWD76_01460, partial [Firmicutes bacterium]|nr:hypothetical protein [Bacillota bacterium]